MGKQLLSNFVITNNYLFFLQSKTSPLIKLILLSCFPLLFGGNYYAQEVAPLKVGNYWVYDNGYKNFGKKTVIDDNIPIDSVEYYEVLLESNHSTFQYSRYMRLSENGYYAVRLDTSYPAPNYEQLYYKKDAVIGDTWENPGDYFPMVYTVVDTTRLNVFGQMVTVKRIEIDGSLFFSLNYGRMNSEY